MKTKLLSLFLTVALLVGIVCGVPVTVSAQETNGIYTYTVTDGKATLTDVDQELVQATNLIIPSEIGGYPVVGMNGNLFENCKDIVTVTLPEGLASLRGAVFLNCKNITTVTVPTSLTDVDVAPFNGCDALTTIHWGNGIETIPPNIFEGCFGLKNVTLPATVKEIGKRAFFSCTGLNTVVLPDGIETIGEQAFASCTSLPAVRFPEGLTAINRRAFEECTALTMANLPSSLTHLGDVAFSKCTALKEVFIPKGITNTLMAPFDYCDSLTDVTFEKGITKIYANLFDNCTGLVSIDIPYTVTEIRENAFKSCVNLKTVNLSEHLEKMGHDAFAYCSSLTKLELPESLTDITFQMFHGCTALKEINIPKNWTKIPENTFAGCTALETVTIPKNLTEIMSGAFSGCTALKTLVFPETSSLNKIGSGTFRQCSALKEMILPENVREIGQEAFRFCRGLVTLSIPASTKKIGVNAFEGCVSLSNLTIADYSLTQIPNYAFADCPALRNIVLPKGLTSIGQKAFALTEEPVGDVKQLVTIPESVTTIDASAFTYKELVTITGRPNSYAHTFARLQEINFVEQMKDLESLQLKDGVTELTVFVGETYRLEWDITPADATECVTVKSNLANVVVEGMDLYCKTAGNCHLTATSTSGKTFEFDLHIVTPVGLELTSLPATTGKLGESFDLTNLTVEVVCKEGVSVPVKDYHLSGISLYTPGPQTVTVSWETAWGETYEQAFSILIEGDYDPAKDFLYIKHNPIVEAARGGASEELSSYIEITGYIGSSEYVTIPETINNLPVTQIGNTAFQNKQSLKSVTIPDTVTFIQETAFNGCAEDLKIIAPENSAAQSFAQNKGFSTVTLVVGSSTEPDEFAVLGDINDDGSINAKDALEVLKYSVEKVEFTDKQKRAGDVNKDEVINAKDALEILKYAVNKPSALG